MRVLGPFEVSRDGRLLSPGGPKERKLLAVLVNLLDNAGLVLKLADGLLQLSVKNLAVGDDNY